MALTPFLRLSKPPFDSIPWDQAINGDMDIIDGAMAQFLAIPNFAGAWTNATTYTVGQVLLDPTDSSMRQCMVSHTSAAYPTTFAQDRTNNPTYWTNATNVPADYALQAKASADAADISEANALASANTATTQAGYSATSALNSKTWWDNFRGTYYGPLASAPTLDPLGQPATLGDLYFSTSMNRMQEFTSNGWQDLTYNYMDRYLPFTGGTMFGPITLAADPTTNLQAATRQYVDNKIISSTGGVASFNTRIGIVTLTKADVDSAGGPYLPTVGDTMHGPIDMGGFPIHGIVNAPQVASDVANKAYVDSAVSGVPGGALISDTAPTAVPGALWWDSLGGQMYVRYNDTNSVQWVTTHNESTSQLYTDNAVAGTLNNVGRNKLHNSMFNVAQRGAGPWTTLAFTVDRWSLALNLDTTTAAQLAVADADRTQLGDEQFTYCMNVAVTGNAGAAAYSELTQRIEGVRRLAGKTVILSFYGRYTAGTPKIGIGLWQNFGTGGSPSANVFMTGQPVTIIGTWARYSVTFAVPSAVGKTLGTAGDDSTAIEFWFSSGTTQANRAGNIGVQSGTFQLWGVQLEIAQPGQTQPTPLEKPDPVQQLQQCQRFYTTGFCYCIGTPGAGAFIGCTVSFNTTMRAYPSIAFTGTTYTNASAIAVGGGGDAHSFGVYVTATAAGPANFTSVYTASADL